MQQPAPPAKAEDPAPEVLGVDPHRLYERVEHTILGSPRTLTRVQAAEQAGVDLDRAAALWRALGFPSSASDEEVAFSDADVQALRLFSWLVETGVIDPASELTLVRSMGRSFARLAEWEVAELSAAAMTGSMLGDPSRLDGVISSLVPVVEDIQTYVWRRHLANAAGRLLLRADGESLLAVGFADIVGFTRRSRGLSRTDLARLVETFEAVSAAIVTEHHGRVIKTIGDEVLFVADDPLAAGRIALELVEATEREDDFPEIRVGLGYGEVLSRLGDVYGPVVNIAARLTSLARPGRVLLDRRMHEELGARTDEFRVKRGRTTAVRGYARLDTWTLTRPKVKR